MPYRKVQLNNEEFFHVCSKSIAGYVIFNNRNEFLRMIQLIRYYQIRDVSQKFSHFIDNIGIEGFDEKFAMFINKNAHKKLVRLVAYCLMPTHLHLVLQQLMDNGISLFLKSVLNGYSSYFNLKHNRRGPLWEGRFQAVLIESNEQLLHLTRYVHLNPATAGIVHMPEDWEYSSYREHTGENNKSKNISQFEDIIDLSSRDYQKFVNDRISYQKELARIKNLLLE